MTDLAPRPGELTAVVHRERFDEPPGDLTSEQDLARWVAFRERYHRAQRGDGPEDFPLQVDLEVNSSCQMKCAFCVHGQGVVPKRELDFDDFARVIREGERHGLCSVKLNYINEPLLRRDLYGLVRYAKGHGVLNVYFATNGLLLTGEVADELIDARLSKIMVSLDATTPETFSLVRRSTKLALVEENIRNLLSIRRMRRTTWPLVRVNFLRTAANAHEAEAFARRWEGVADSIGFQRQVRMPGVVDDLLGDAGEAGPFRCSFPSKLLVVDSAGNILPCCTFSGREMPFGNIREMSLAEAWTGQKARELRRLHARGDGMANPVCAHCVGAASS